MIAGHIRQVNCASVMAYPLASKQLLTTDTHCQSI